MSGLKNTKVRSRLVARNPVARAFAMKTLRDSAVEAQAHVYSLKPGEHERDFIITTARFFTVVLVAAGEDKLQDHPEYDFKELLRVLNHAMDSLMAMTKHGYTWDYSKAHDISDAIDASLLITPKLTPEAINHAWHAVEHI